MVKNRGLRNIMVTFLALGMIGCAGNEIAPTSNISHVLTRQTTTQRVSKSRLDIVVNNLLESLGDGEYKFVDFDGDGVIDKCKMSIDYKNRYNVDVLFENSDNALSRGIYLFSEDMNPLSCMLINSRNTFKFDYLNQKVIITGISEKPVDISLKSILDFQKIEKEYLSNKRIFYVRYDELQKEEIVSRVQYEREINSAKKEYLKRRHERVEKKMRFLSENYKNKMGLLRSRLELMELANNFLGGKYKYLGKIYKDTNKIAHDLKDKLQNKSPYSKR